MERTPIADLVDENIAALINEREEQILQRRITFVTWISASVLG
jgi:hypothetical protein